MKNILIGIFIIFFGYLLLHSMYLQLSCFKIIEGAVANQSTDDKNSPTTTTTATSADKKDDKKTENNDNNPEQAAGKADNWVSSGQSNNPTAQTFNNGIDLASNHPNPLP
jgi:hypothetical protein